MNTPTGIRANLRFEKKVNIGYFAMKGLNVAVAPFQGACFAGYLPRVSPWAITFRPFGAHQTELSFLCELRLTRMRGMDYCPKSQTRPS